MQEVIVNVLFIAVLVVLAGTLFFDVRKKRNRMKTAEREGVELAADLNSKLPEGYVVLKDLYILTKLGRSRIDYVIVSPQGIFALEYRELYGRQPLDVRTWHQGQAIHEPALSVEGSSPLHQGAHR